MSAFRGDFYILGVNGTAIGGIKSAGGIVFGVDNYMVHIDDALFARGKDSISTIGIGIELEIGQGSDAVARQEDRILSREIAGIYVTGIAGFAKGRVCQGDGGSIAGQEGVFIGGRRREGLVIIGARFMVTDKLRSELGGILRFPS